MDFANLFLRKLRPYKLASHKIWDISPAQREDILKLDWNEATIPPSPFVRQRIMDLLSEPDFFHLYPSTKNKRLLSLLSEYTNLREENVQYFASSDSLHEYICKVFISPDDPVIILGPSYDNFRLTCQANGANIHFSNVKEDFSFDQKRFEKDIAAIKPKLVYICNPNNPTGLLHHVSYIKYLVETFTDILFLIDEAYYEFAGETCKDLVQDYGNILISRTFSKAFALANFRIGYLLAAEDNIQAINRIRNPKNVSTIAQEAAIAALLDTEYMYDYVAEVKEGMNYFITESEKKKYHFSIIPSSGNFNLLKFNTYEEKIRLLSFLAENNIFVRDTMQDSILFNCFRITCGTKSQMNRVLSVIDHLYR